MSSYDMTLCSIVLAAIGLGSTLLLAYKLKSGWLVGIAANALNIPYDIMTKQYGWVPTSLVAAVIAAAAWRRWNGNAIHEGPVVLGLRQEEGPESARQDAVFHVPEDRSAQSPGRPA